MEYDSEECPLIVQGEVSEAQSRPVRNLRLRTECHANTSERFFFSRQNRTFGKGDNALRYLAIDLSVPFYGDAHTRAVFVNIIPIVLHVIGFPLYLGYVLYKYRLNLQRNRSSSAVRSSISAKLEGHYEVYGFLVAGYREGVEWWEFTILLRRL